MGIFGKLFTWWDGATIGTMLYTAREGEHVGTDAQGNKYYRSKPKEGEKERRWVIYNGNNDASRVPSEWHGWLHGAFDDVPESRLPPAKIWEADYTPNATGTVSAYRPQGALERGGKRAKATGDYESWSPES
ncbi:NADH:ubiquinone oxidoreductase subunit NDUFA12 [Altererythrobacter sp.]|uniref:NADH:ubiquinone oxidoreductase subunit NDUFA12 n=1 Tax=Altererythrobacter sp. TaxID=1872480 RepID=UPI001B079C83|nr:NADH:ubiquinone oxidoreductase subunit NDUFA12 [Altererythrobacter sp.]MBO6609291.1 NADH:ubiquinone oxidoreductase subunit NDUFA12 [Altererythrobacter sp.]MBO6640708.1 NADH:ubiquinone oxidoreductase subunit NDUFA12 [Altererythrobacter sp.]MBO6708594.1 NADH:ubiquinone oxidoreductase subunit NDUFA12 [Altererythrobacter sp.]